MPARLTSYTTSLDRTRIYAIYYGDPTVVRRVSAKDDRVKFYVHNIYAMGYNTHRRPAENGPLRYVFFLSAISSFLLRWKNISFTAPAFDRITGNVTS